MGWGGGPDGGACCCWGCCCKDAAGSVRGCALLGLGCAGPAECWVSEGGASVGEAPLGVPAWRVGEAGAGACTAWR